ncbi:MAG TPA: hypothetical protein VMX74_05505, partial [Pirellulales bacterium]|nr:hypothetical protein [Pirellulales bacterium]
EPQVVVDAGSKPRGDLFPLPGVPTDTSTKIVGREADVEASASKQSTDDEKPPIVDAAPAPVISVVRPAKELNVKKPVDSGKHVNTNVADRVVDRNASDDFEVPQDVLVTPGQPPRRLPVTSSNRIDLVAKTCEQHIRYGRDLAGRGATQSARQEYIEVLNRISQALDYDFTEPHHSKALAAGLTALHESRTFHSNANRLSTEIDVPTLVAIHRTPALKEQASIGSISPVMAQQRYLEYAKQQLVLASGGQPVASKALYSIARLESVDICEMPMSMPNAGPRAIALHQAALMVDARNYPAANELGVLFARYGQIETAKSALTMATRHSTEPEAWYNLAKVLEMEGSTQRAAQARNNYQRMRAEKQQASTTTGEASVRWVAPAAFSSSADPAGVGLYERSVDNEASPAAAQDRGDSKSTKSSDGQAGSSPFQGFSRFFNRQEK